MEKMNKSSMPVTQLQALQRKARQGREAEMVGITISHRQLKRSLLRGDIRKRLKGLRNEAMWIPG